MMAEVLIARRDRALPALPALPADYAAMTPEMQMRAQVERHWAQLSAVTPQPGDLDVIEAEIID